MNRFVVEGQYVASLVQAALVGLVAVLAASSLTYVLVEKPGMRLGHRLAARWERRAAPPSAAARAR